MDLENKHFGQGILIEGECLIENECVNENSLIFLTKQSSHNSLGVVSVSHKEKGKFLIKSSYYHDSDYVAYLIINS